MGYTTALGIADTDISLEQQMAWHLTGNFYPPIPTSMVQPCIDAIQAFEDGDYDRQISLPDAITWKGKAWSTAYAIVDAHRLEPFIQDSYEDYDQLDEYLMGE